MKLDRSALLWVLLVVVLLVLVVNPLARLVWTSLQDPAGGVTLANYAAAYGRWRNVEALRRLALLVENRQHT